MAMHSVAIIRTSSGNTRVTCIKEALELFGFSVTEVADSAVGSTNFSSYAVVIACQTAVSVAQLTTINKPTIFGSASPVQGMGLTAAAPVTSNNVNTQGWEVVNTTHEVSIGQVSGNDTFIGMVVDLLSASEGFNSASAFIGTALTEWPTGSGLNHKSTVAIESGTARLTSGTTWARMGYIGWIGQHVSVGSIQGLTEEAIGMLVRMVMWCIDEVVGINKDWVLSLGATDYNFASDTVGSPPANMTAVSGSLRNVNRERAAFNGQRAIFAADGDRWRYTLGGVADKHDVYMFWLKGSSVSDEMNIACKDFRYWCQIGMHAINGLFVRFWRSGGTAVTGQTFIPAFTIGNFRWLWTRFRCWDESGSTTLQVKVWAGRLEDEPASWHLSTTNGVHFGQTGRVETLHLVTTVIGISVLSPLAGILTVEPDTPVVTVPVDSITGSSADVDGSAFSSQELPLPTHVSTEVWIRKASDDSIVRNYTLTSGDLTYKANAGPLEPLTEYYAQMAYTDSNQKTSDIGTSDNFTTLDLDGCVKIGLPMTAEDVEYTKAAYLGGTSPWGNYTSIGNPLDGMMIAFRYGVLSKPRVLLLNECREHDESQGLVIGGFDGEVAGAYYPWYTIVGNRYQGIEWSQLGVALIAKGEIGNPANPFSGFIGWLNIGIPIPYGVNEDGRMSLSGCLGMGISYPGSAYTKIEVWEGGIRVSATTANVSNAKRPSAIHRECENFPMYHLLFKATKDLIADPDGKTWDLQLAFEEDDDPDGSTWDLEATWTSEVIVCGRSGPAIELVPGATGGAAGAIFISSAEVNNLGEFCGTEVTEELPTTDPTVEACASCSEIRADVYGWSGPDVTTPTEARWKIKLASDDSVLYDTDWQSDQIEAFDANTFDLAEFVEPGLTVYMTVQLRDEDLTTSAEVESATFVIGSPPEPFELTVLHMFVDKARLFLGPYVSPGGAVHEVTQIGIFAGTDTELLTPLETYEFSLEDGDQLEGIIEIEYSFDLTLTYRFRAIYTDEFACASAVGTEFLVDDDEEPPNPPGDGEEPHGFPESPVSCPIWDETCTEEIDTEWEENCDDVGDNEWDETPTC